MNEFELTRRALEGPATDPTVRERAHARLLQAIKRDEERRRRPRVRVLAAAALALVVILVLALVVISPFGAGPAAAELRRLSALASSSNARTAESGQYVLGRSEELRPEGSDLLTGGAPFTVLSHLMIKTWIAPDGSAFRRTEWIASDFATASDREAWEAAGRPDVPTAGDVRMEQYKPGEAPWLDASALPTDPDALIEGFRREPALSGRQSDEQTFREIGSLLAQGDAGPELRSALLEVAARLDGVQLIGEVTDPIGRPGVALAVDGETERTQLVFDPDTSHLLAIESYPIGEDGSIGPLASWATSEPATVFDSGPRG